MEQLIPETIFKHTKDYKVIRRSENLFIKGKQCMTNLITFYDDITGLVDEQWISSI